MRYLLAILLPPLAVFLCGKPVQGILNIILTLLFWVPGIVHALFVVNSHLADKRNQELIKAIKEKDGN
nr:YqaE/Pmp3 family membrane protein [Parendozoicomonas sp. Alg238-R29]